MSRSRCFPEKGQKQHLHIESLDNTAVLIEEDKKKIVILFERVNELLRIV